MPPPPLATLHPHKPPHHLLAPVKVALRGQLLLTASRLNKGTAFTLAERSSAQFGLSGRLPYKVNTLEEQCARAHGQLRMRGEAGDETLTTRMRKNTFLQSLKEQNWTLYYAFLARNLKELVPVIYTPTEADAISNYSHLFRRSEGLYLSLPNQDRMEEDFLEQMKGRDLDLVVCTDAEAILGIGDQGVGGIGISTAKSVIYTLIGGLDPARSLSVMLDVGTDNPALLKDPLYVGWQAKRVRGHDYDKFVDKFVQLVRKHLPHSLLHFEDFRANNAYRLLQKYRDSHAVFNDDIQGTGAVTLACIMAAIGVSSRSQAAVLASSASPSPASATPSRLLPNARLSDQRYLILGAGSAGMGIATQIRDAMIAADGVSREEANEKFWLVDRDGLLWGDVPEEDWGHVEAGKGEGGRGEFYRGIEGWAKVIEARKAEQGKEGKQGIDESIEWEGVDPHSTSDSSTSLPPNPTLLEVIPHAKPTVLIGCSTASGAFTQPVVQTMLENLPMSTGIRPIIMPLSNPTRLAEATPGDLVRWTGGRVLVATGSPFGDVGWEGGKFVIASCNNALIYPGLGFGAILARSRRITDTMLLEGAKRLASLSPALLAADSESGTQRGYANYQYQGEALLPDFDSAPGVNFEIGVAVAEQAVREGSAGAEWFSGADQQGEGERHERAEDTAIGEVREMHVRAARERAGEKVWVPVYREYVFDEGGVVD